jgi:putative hydrolase of the HAD superfamily
MAEIRAVISDFGGVLTSPLVGSFAAVQDRSGVSLEALGNALQAITERTGENPLFVLERGEMTEHAFLLDLGGQLSADLGHEVEMHGFGAAVMEHLHPNEPMIEFMRGLRDRGLRAAILTNNVREWEPLWRRMLPVDEIFELVVDSAFVGMRKPDPRIYELTLDRLGLPAEACLFVDDIDVNIAAARELGIHAVHFQTTEQAIAEMEEVLAGGTAASWASPTGPSSRG